MDKREEGFTLIELMITMVIFVFVIAGASSIFTGLLTQFKQQSKIAETNIEGAVGLEILRRDLESAGYGLARNVEIDNTESPGDGNDWEQLVEYCEAISAPPNPPGDPNDPPDPATFNNGVTSGDCTAGETGGSQPRAIFSGNGSGVNGSDYLVIRATNVATNVTAHKWTYLQTTGPKTWTPDCENVNKNPDCSTNNTVRVIVISPGGSTTANARSLITSSATTGVFTTQYNGISNFAPPTGSTESYIVYGVDRDTKLRMPFNRADYFIRRFDASNDNITPERCAPNTGVLEKATVNQSNGALNFMPILDCVADIQVVYTIDEDEDGDFELGVGGDRYDDDLAGITAQDIIDKVKEVRVYILAHEGQRDPNYTSPNPMLVGPDTALGRNVDVSANINYRWKVYTIVVKTNNLR